MNTNKFWSNETFIRIISLLFAIILWMYVVSVDNPQIDTTIRNIPVQVVNIGNVENNGLEIISMSDEKIDVKISGRMSDISDVTSDDITVQLDVSSIYSANNYYIKPDVSINASGISVVGLSVDSINVYVDYISRIEKEVVIETVGQPEEGYSVSEVYSANSKVIVSGPQGIINRIDKLKAVVDVSGATKELSKVCEVKMFSSNGEEIVSDKVKLSITDISVSVKLEYFKTLPIITDLHNVSGFQADAYNIIVSVPEIEVFGEEAVLKDVTQITATVIDIPFDNEELLVTKEWQVKLNIPEGLTVKDDISKITIKFEKK